MKRMTKSEVLEYLRTLRVTKTVNAGSNRTSPIFFCVYSDGSAIAVRAISLKLVLCFLRQNISNGKSFTYERDNRVKGMLAWVYSDGINKIEIIQCCDNNIRKIYNMQ